MKNMSRTTSTSSSITLLVGPALRGGLLLLVALVLPACQKPLLSPNEPRSQYDTYDAVRNQYAPQQFRDEFGRLRPNIRQRLLAKE